MPAVLIFLMQLLIKKHIGGIDLIINNWQFDLMIKLITFMTYAVLYIEACHNVHLGHLIRLKWVLDHV